MADYIPSGDADFIEFAQNFITKIDGTEALYGLTAATTTALNTMLTTFETSYSDNNAGQTTARSLREKKDADRAPLESRLREAAQTVQTTSSVTDAQRADLRITIPDSLSVPDGPPQSRPVAEIDTSEPLRHTVKFYDTDMEVKGKPAGVRGAEIFCKVGGEATMNEDDYRYLGTDTRSPYLAVHKPADVGKQAHYLLRWINDRGESGAWSNPVTATITG